MRIARENGMLIMLHAENGDVIECWWPRPWLPVIPPRMACPHPPGLGRGGSGAARRGRPGRPGGAPLYIVHMNVGRRSGHARSYAREHGLHGDGRDLPAVPVLHRR